MKNLFLYVALITAAVGVLCFFIAGIPSTDTYEGERTANQIMVAIIFTAFVVVELGMWLIF